MQARILIVEDEPIIAEDLSMILKNASYNVVGIANTGTVALDYLHSRNPDLVLLDIALAPEMSGFDIAEIINEKYKIPFIFITSFSDKATLDRAKKVLPYSYIVKPFKKKDIISNIEIALHKAAQQKDSGALEREELNQRLHTSLSEKEYEILVDISQGLSNAEIGEKHFISMNTVKTHVKRLFTKLDVNSRSKAASLIRQ